MAAGMGECLSDYWEQFHTDMYVCLHQRTGRDRYHYPPGPGGRTMGRITERVNVYVPNAGLSLVSPLVLLAAQCSTPLPQVVSSRSSPIAAPAGRNQVVFLSPGGVKGLEEAKRSHS